MLTTPPPSWASWQSIINSHDVPDRSTVVTADEPVPVVARIVWATTTGGRREGLSRTPS